VNVERRLAARLAFVAQLHDLTDGSRTRFVPTDEVIADLRYSQEEIRGVVEYLQGEALIDEVAGLVTITHTGVREVEQALRNPERPTLHFPAAVNIINVENMYGSQIQQGTTDSTQEGHFLSGTAADSLRDALAVLRADLADVVLDAEDRSELVAEIGTAEQQLGSSRPKLATIRGSMQRITQLLTKATVVTGSAVQLAAHVEKLRQLLPGL
jgi:hypothetical protein